MRSADYRAGDRIRLSPLGEKRYAVDRMGRNGRPRAARTGVVLPSSLVMDLQQDKIKMQPDGCVRERFVLAEFWELDPAFKRPVRLRPIRQREQQQQAATQQVMLAQRIAAGGGFAPTDIASCVWWIPAYSLVGLSNNDPISTYVDQSISGNNATASGAQRPIYKTNILNGLPVARFSGAQWMDLVSALTGSSYTIVGVFAATSPGMLMGNSGDNYQLLAPRDSNPAKVSIYAGSNDVISILPASLASFSVVTWRVTNGGGTEFFQNGALNSSGAYAGAANFNELGAFFGGSAPFVGDLADLAFFNDSISDGDHDDLIDYEMTTFGL